MFFKPPWLDLYSTNPPLQLAEHFDFFPEEQETEIELAVSLRAPQPAILDDEPPEEPPVEPPVQLPGEDAEILSFLFDEFCHPFFLQI